jgi:hypothetical protein
MTGQPAMHIMVFMMHFLALYRQRSPIWSLGSPFGKVARLECGGRAQRRHRFSQFSETEGGVRLLPLIPSLREHQNRRTITGDDSGGRPARNVCDIVATGGLSSLYLVTA